MKSRRISGMIFLINEMRKFFVNQKWFNLASLATQMEHELREKESND